VDVQKTFSRPKTARAIDARSWETERALVFRIIAALPFFFTGGGGGERCNWGKVVAAAATSLFEGCSGASLFDTGADGTCRLNALHPFVFSLVFNNRNKNNGKGGTRIMLF